MAHILRDLTSQGEKSWGRLLGAPSIHEPTSVRSKPSEFNIPFETARALAYQCCDGDAREMASGGVLGPQAKVWLPQRSALMHSGRVLGFIDPVGLVTIDRRGLARADRHHGRSRHDAATADGMPKR